MNTATWIPNINQWRDQMEGLPRGSDVKQVMVQAPTTADTNVMSWNNVWERCIIDLKPSESYPGQAQHLPR